ncbi:MAG: response regulator [Schwartzia sp.]|nr:response regulator [Schwartzia sp. (in: firmicutes)]
MKILIAEDDRMSRSFLKEFLADYGAVDAATNGMEAIDLFLDAIKEKEPYDLLCLDIMMPKVDGLKVLKVIRELEEQQKIEKHLKIIMMSALSEVDYVQEAFRLGCDAYAAKPIDTGKVVEAMKNLGLTK